MPPIKRKPPAKPTPAKPTRAKKRSVGFKKAALAASGLAVLAAVAPTLRKLFKGKDEELFRVVFEGAPAAAGYPTTAKQAVDDEAMAKLMRAMESMGLENADGWTGAKLGLTGETAGTGHVGALFGSGMLKSDRFKRLAGGLHRAIQKTRAIGPAAKMKISEAGANFLKHVNPRKTIAKMTRPQRYAALAALIAAVAAVGGRHHLQAAVQAGMKLPAFREAMPDDFGDFEMVDMKPLPNPRAKRTTTAEDNVLSFLKPNNQANKRAKPSSNLEAWHRAQADPADVWRRAAGDMNGSGKRPKKPCACGGLKLSTVLE
jgi:hypothetical protein